MAPKPPAKPKPTRKPKGPAQYFVDDGRSVAPRDPRALDGRPSDALVKWASETDARLARIESRLDRMADALAPALHAWRNIKQRIPAWLLSIGETRDPPPDTGEE